MEHHAPHLHTMNTDNQERIIAAVGMVVVGINVSPHNLLLIVFKVMALPVFEFQDQGYKIRKVLA